MYDLHHFPPMLDFGQQNTENLEVAPSHLYVSKFGVVLFLFIIQIRFKIKCAFKQPVKGVFLKTVPLYIHRIATDFQYSYKHPAPL